MSGAMVDEVRALDLPPGRACRCGRIFGAQVDPETNEIAHTEWET